MSALFARVKAVLRAIVFVFLFVLRKLFWIVGWLAGLLFGRLNWQAPGWLSWSGGRARRVGGWMQQNRARSAAAIAALVVLVVAGAFGWRWYQSRPKPVETTFSVEAPPLTEWDHDQPKPAPLTVTFEEGVAPLDAVEKTVTHGVTMKPNLAGEWRWASDRKLVFQPKGDWPIDGEFEVGFDRKILLAPQIRLAKDDFEFRTAPFSVKVDKAEFYQDPRDPNMKKLVATLSFSHPVDDKLLKEKIKLSLGGGLSFIGLGDAPPFALSFDKNKLNAFIHSAPLAIPREDTPLTLNIAAGLRAQRGGNALKDAINAQVNIPGLYSLSFNDIGMTVVDNDRFEPEQVLRMASTAPVSEAAIRGKVQAWLLPEQHPTKPNTTGKPWRWASSDVTQDLLAKSDKVALQAVPGELEQNSLHGFKFNAPVGRYLFVKVDEGVQSFGGYQSGKPATAIVQVQPWPKTLKLLSQGALVSLTGEKKVAFVARGIAGVRLEIGRLLPNQLHHLVSGNSGSFAEPDISTELEDSLVERLSSVRAVPPVEPGKPAYDNVDLASYLASGRMGLFLLKLSPADPARPDQHQAGPTDRRLLLITDLGIITKRAVSGETDVFVQSISSGQPVAGAEVQVMGRNGMAVLSRTTGVDGKVQLPKLDEFRREKQALMLVAARGNDMSFLPMNRSDRRLDFSRFDIGGAPSQEVSSGMSAYVFTDRGLYRPGETAHVAYIVRTATQNAPVEGLPVEVEVNDPRGLTVERKRINLSRYGFESFDFTPADTAPTGQYSATIYLVNNAQRSDAIGNVSFKVQEFEADRMKVSARLADKIVDGWIAPEAVKAKVTAMQLFGAPAAGRKVTGDLDLSPAVPAFPRYKDYRFFDPSRLKDPFQETLAPTTTNDAGEAELDLNLKRFARATYRLHLTTRVFEAAGGRGVSAESAVLVSSAPYLLGIKEDGPLNFVSRGSQRSAQVLGIGPDLAARAVDGLTLAFVERRFVSVLTRQGDGTYKYESRRKEVQREVKPLSIPVAGIQLPLPTDAPGDYAIVLRDGQGVELNRVEYSVAGAANISRSLERNAELQLTLDKTDYAPGDSIKISLRAPYAGAGLITIERDHVYAHAWFKASTTSSVQTITLPKDFEGNGYINVQFLRDPTSPEVFLSPLSYGVVPFAVNLDARKTQLELTAAAQTKPGEPLSIRLTSSQPARVALVAVDEGILQVAGYRTPDPLSHFFRKRALEVDTHQILDLVLPEFAQLLASAAGGDGAGALGRHLNPFKRKHQPPVAWWSGLVDVGPAGINLRYTPPETFNGRLRIFAIAVNANRIGVTEVKSEVRGDLILSPNVPAFVAPGDEFVVSTGVYNNLPGGKAAVSVSLTPSRELQILGDANVKLDLAGGQESVASWRVKALDFLGSASLRFVAGAQGKQGRALESISVRPAVPYRAQFNIGRFDGSDTRLPLTRALYDEYRKVGVTASGSPIAWLPGLQAYLDDYPYGCTEQIVSRAFPALLALHDEPAKSGKIVASVISELRQRQNDDGSFGLWASNWQVDPFASVYAINFLIEAKERGYAVPGDLLDSATSWLGHVASGESEGLSGARVRAYAIYLLTRQGRVSSGLLNSLLQDLNARYAKEWPQDITAAFVAGAQAQMQQKDSALRLLRAVPWRTPESGTTWDGPYYDNLVHDALLIQLTARHFPERLASVPDKVLEAIVTRLNKQQYNSLSTALLILALDSYGHANSDVRVSATALQKGGKALALVLSAARGSAAVPQGTETVQLSRTGKGAAFWSLSESGFDRSIPSGELHQGLEVFREYLAADGSALGKVKVGDELQVRIRLRATDRDSVSEVALVDLLPGGMEPIFETNAQVKQEEESAPEEQEGDEGTGEANARPGWQSPIGLARQSTWLPTYADVRDDRVVLYGTASRDAATFTYRVRAVSPGKFVIPPAYAEGMYERQIQARSKAGTIEILAP